MFHFFIQYESGYNLTYIPFIYLFFIEKTNKLQNFSTGVIKFNSLYINTPVGIWCFVMIVSGSSFRYPTWSSHVLGIPPFVKVKCDECKEKRTIEGDHSRRESRTKIAGGG